MANITVFVIIAAMVTGVTLYSMPVTQQASAICGEVGNLEKGAHVSKCNDFGVKCHSVQNPNGNTHGGCKPS